MDSSGRAKNRNNNRINSYVVELVNCKQGGIYG